MLYSNNASDCDILDLSGKSRFSKQNSFPPRDLRNEFERMVRGTGGALSKIASKVKKRKRIQQQQQQNSKKKDDFTKTDICYEMLFIEKKTTINCDDNSCSHESSIATSPGTSGNIKNNQKQKNDHTTRRISKSPSMESDHEIAKSNLDRGERKTWVVNKNYRIPSSRSFEHEESKTSSAMQNEQPSTFQTASFLFTLDQQEYICKLLTQLMEEFSSRLFVEYNKIIEQHMETVVEEQKRLMEAHQQKLLNILRHERQVVAYNQTSLVREERKIAQRSNSRLDSVKGASNTLGTGFDDCSHESKRKSVSNICAHNSQHALSALKDKQSTDENVCLSPAASSQTMEHPETGERLLSPNNNNSCECETQNTLLSTTLLDSTEPQPSISMILMNKSDNKENEIATSRSDTEVAQQSYNDPSTVESTKILDVSLGKN